MKVFLANAPWRKPGFYGVRAGSRWPHFEKKGCSYMPFPFFLAYSAELLRKAGFNPALVDAIAEGLDEDAFFARMEAFAPEVIFFEISTASLNTDLRILERTRALLGDTVRIVLGGAHFGMSEPDFLTRHIQADYVLTGEYEFNLLHLLTHLRESRVPDDVAGLIFRRADGSIAANPAGKLQEDLDAFPWPARDLLPLERYCDRPGDIPAPSLQIIASRGCPFGCIFCAWPQLMYGGNSYRTRSPKDVVDEIEDCVKRYGFKSFYFDDDTFNIGKKRVLALAREIKDRGLNLPWAIMARADQMDREILGALKDAGLTALKYGVESGSQALLDQACKGLDLEKVTRTVRDTRELGISYHLTFMFGLPGETLETARQTIETALALDPDSLQFSIATPFPGSRFHKHLLEKGHLLSTNYDDYDGYHNSVVRTEALTAEDLIRLRSEAEQAWAEHRRKRQAAAGPA
jgi:radical SAM superfamily enzyme YgiQ (UPF0313 family)